MRMEIKFTEQAEKMIKQMSNQPAIKSRLIELAKQRSMIISGGDVIKFVLKGNLLTCIDLQEV